MKIAITTESASDTPQEILSKYDIKTIPFGVSIGDEEYLDGEISIDEVFRKAKEKNTLPKTNAVNQFQYEEFFKDLMQKNDFIIHFSLSGTISSAYNNAKSVADRFNEGFKNQNLDKKIFVVNSLGISSSIVLLILKACKMREEGMTAAQIFENVISLIPKVQLSLIVDKLTYLHKGGRCSTLAYFGSTILKIHPQIIVDHEGKLNVGKKFMGNIVDSVKKYCADILDKNPNPDLDVAFVGYTTDTGNLVTYLVNTLKERGFKHVYVARVGTTIAAHTGEQSFGVIFLNK